MSIGPSVRDLGQYLLDIGYDAVYRQSTRATPARGANAASSEPVVVPHATPGDGARSPMPSEAAAPPSMLGAFVPAADGTLELASVGELASRCTACKLAAGRHSVVFGSGDPNADLMLIGEGPGAEEDRQGLPFVGRAGELLTRMIVAIELQRDQVYIANIVKCRPPNNRDPEPDEVAACRGFLEKQIDLVRPRVICALGRIAAQTLLGVDTPIGRMRGQWTTVRGVATMVTYHPAALLRNPALKRPTWDDLQLVRARLRESA